MLGACQTAPKPLKVHLPVAYEAGFATCEGGDGALSLRWYDAGRLLETIPVDWVAWPDKGWAMAMTSPFGQTLFKITYQREGQRFIVDGLERPVPELGVLENGLLTIDDRYVGIKATEIPCVLSGRLPRDWLQRVVAWQPGSDELTFSVRDADRDIHTTLKIDEQGDINFCSHIRWGYYWGLVNRDVEWCSSNLVTTITGPESFRIELEKQEHL